jgi:RNA polymerase sigma-32 factor
MQGVLEMSKNLPTARADLSVSKLTPLQLYLKEIAKYPLLSPEEELDNAQRHFEEGDIAAAHRLVTSNLRLVVKIANDFRQAQNNLLDLIQEGNYGLMQAVKKFNPYKGVKLSSYAAWWIRAYILKFIMDNKSQVKIGTTAAQRKLFFNLRKEMDRLLQEYDEVDTKMLAESLNVREKDITDMQMRLQGPDFSLDAPLGEDDGETRGSQLSLPEATIEENLAIEEIRQHFAEHIEEFRHTLKGRDLEIFQERIMAENPLTLQEIGDRYKVTRERARQLEAKVIARLKAFVKTQGIIDIEG